MVIVTVIVMARMVIVTVIVMVRMVFVTVIVMARMVIVTVITVAVAMVVRCVQLRFHLVNLGEQRTTLVGQFRFEGCDLAFDFFQRTRHAVCGDNAKGVGGGDQIVVRQAKLSVRPRITNRPVELLGVHLHAKGIL